MTHEEFKNAPSEIARYRHLVAKYCEGPGLDVASQGDCVVPWGWSLELPEAEFAHYNSNNPPKGPIQLRGHAENLRMIGTGSLSWLCASHLLEDYTHEQWPSVLTEWKRVVKSGGYLIVLCPERNLWAAALRRGQGPNNSHRYEPVLGDFLRISNEVGLEVIEERLTALVPEDYTILAIFRKP